MNKSILAFEIIIIIKHFTSFSQVLTGGHFLKSVW